MLPRWNRAKPADRVERAPPAQSGSVAKVAQSPDTEDRADPRNHRAASLGALAVVMVLAGIIYYIASLLRYQEFYTTNWDLGINMQLLYTTTHGQLLFEAGDYETSLVNSFLFVHPAYIAFPLAGLYGLAPGAELLLGIQASAVALSAVPLYLIGRETRSPNWVLWLGVTVYLTSVALLAGLLYDFHWEAFIPLEFLSTFYLWDRGRYALALVPAVVGILTLQVFPVLLLGLAAYATYPFLIAYVSRPPRTLTRLWRGLTGPVFPMAGLVAVAVVGFFVPGLINQWVLTPALGTPIYPPSPPYTTYGLTFWAGLTTAMIGPRLLYWAVLFASFGFLPLLFRQRLLILSVPWFLYTVVMNPNSAFTTFGFQYSMIAVAPLAIGFIWGLERIGLGRADPPPHAVSALGWIVLLLPLLGASLVASLSIITGTVEGQWILLAVAAFVVAGCIALQIVLPALRSRRPSPPVVLGFRLAQRRPTRIAAAVGLAAVLVACNLALSPLNTANFLGPGNGGYSFTYEPNPVFAYMATVTSQIPAGATVLASDNLFPFVANNPNAYSLLWYPQVPTYLPFNATVLPRFVLLSTSQWFGIPAYLDAKLFDRSAYGIPTVLYSTPFYPGSIYLFELDYSGTTQVVQVSPFPDHQVICPEGLALGPSGTLLSAPGSPCGSILHTSPASNLSGSGPTIWYGPYITLIPGNYSITFMLRGGPSGPEPKNSSVLVMDGSGEGSGYWYYLPINSNEISSTAWTNITLSFALATPVPQSEFRGYLGGVTVNGTFVPGNISLAEITLVRS